MKRGAIDDNQLCVSDINISAVGLIPPIAAVTNVSYIYKIDAQGKRTDQIEGVRYRCANPKDFTVFTLKTLSARAVITAEELAESEDVVYIAIPVK